MKEQEMAICLWYDDKAEEAAKFYTSLFKDGKIVANRVGAANKDALKEWIGASLKG